MKGSDFTILETGKMDIPRFDLTDKVAIITGVASDIGIGRGIARTYAAYGAKLVIADMDAGGIELRAREIAAEFDAEVIPVRCDIRSEEDRKTLVDTCMEAFGRIDILVNNAGVIQRTPMLDMSAEDFRRVVDIDLNAPFIVSKACLPGMIAKGHGKIINICSMMSELGRETIAGYAAAKGGLKMLTKNICSEFGEANIQCNGIGPGYIATPQTAPLRETQPDGSRHPFDQFIIAKTPAARWGTPEDLKGPAVFLASDASNFVNGHILYVDGGILAYIGKQPA